MGCKNCSSFFVNQHIRTDPLLNQQTAPALVIGAALHACHTVAIKQTRNTDSGGRTMKTTKKDKKEYSRMVYMMILEMVFGIRELGNDRYLDITTGRQLSQDQVLDIMSKY